MGKRGQEYNHDSHIAHKHGEEKETRSVEGGKNNPEKGKGKRISGRKKFEILGGRRSYTMIRV